jgi:hypothetical protein
MTGPTAQQQLLAAVKANPALFKQILSFHLVKGVVPAAKVTDGAVLATLSPKDSLKVYRKGKDIELLRPEVALTELEVNVPDAPDADDADDAAEEKERPGKKDHDAHGHPDGMEADAVVAADLTFEGPFVPGKSTYIVHAIEDVMIPPSAAAAAAALAPKPAAAGAAAAAAAAKAAAKPAAPAAKAAVPAAAGKPAAPVTPATTPKVAAPAAKPAPAAAAPLTAVGGRKMI